MLQKHQLNDRYYLTHALGEEPAPAGRALVLAFHGGGSTPRDMARFCGLTEAADRHGFTVVFPAGSGPSPEYLTWNAGSCCGHAARHQVDDVRFIEAMLEELHHRLGLDPTRVYATGMSNGGMFCYRLAAAMPERIAAIAPVAGCLAFDPAPLPRPVPVLHFHGTADEFVPYAGGAGSRSLRRIDFPSVDQTLCRWAERSRLTVNKLPPTAVTTSVGNREIVNDRQLRSSRTVYAQIDGKEGIVEVCIAGGGHTWPGQAPPLCFLGRTMLSLDANHLMWEFFQAFRLPTVA